MFCRFKHHLLLENQWSLVCDKSKKLQNLRKRPADQKRCFLFWIFVGETFFSKTSEKDWPMRDDQRLLEMMRSPLPPWTKRQSSGWFPREIARTGSVQHRMKNGDFMVPLIYETYGNVIYRSYTWMIWMCSFCVLPKISHIFFMGSYAWMSLVFVCFCLSIRNISGDIRLDPLC